MEDNLVLNLRGSLNCDGDHATNRTQCPVYKKYAEYNQKRHQSQRIFVSQSTTVCWLSANATDFFPNKAPKTSLLSYSNIISGSLNTKGSANSPLQNTQLRNLNFNDQFANFASIPNISRTMELFAELTLKLRATEAHHERLQILTQSCCPQMPLKIMSLNCRFATKSVRNKTIELSKFVEKKHFDIIF